MEPVRKGLLPLKLQMFADPGAGSAGGDPGAGSGAAGADDPNAAGAGGTGGNDPAAGGNDQNDNAKALEAQLEQLKADLAKQKEALNKATKEAGDYRKQLQAKMTQEEIDAQNKKAAEEKAAEELEALRKKVAKAENTKSVMSKLGLKEEDAGAIAESLVGCENIENALLLIQKAWTAKEKALRLEFGKIPGPGAGGSSEEDAEEKAALEMARRLGKERGEQNKSVTEGLKGYIR